MLAYDRNAALMLEDSDTAAVTVVVGTVAGTDPAQEYLQHRFAVEFDANSPSFAIQGSTDGTFWVTLETLTTTGDVYDLDRPWAHLRVAMTSGGASTQATIYLEQIRPVAAAGGLS